LIIELFNFELSSPPPKKSCPLITNPNEILAVPQPPKNSLKNIEYPSPIITQKIIHKTSKKIESKKFNKESKQSKKQNKKVCNLYPFSWRNLCFKFFLSHFFVGSECYEKTKTKNNHTTWSATTQNTHSIDGDFYGSLLRYGSLWTSLFIINDFHFTPLLSRIRICTVYLDIFCMYVNKCCFDAIAKIMVVFVIILNKLGWVSVEHRQVSSQSKVNM